MRIFNYKAEPSKLPNGPFISEAKGLKRSEEQFIKATFIPKVAIYIEKFNNVFI
jgi:hypothetical protein